MSSAGCCAGKTGSVRNRYTSRYTGMHDKQSPSPPHCRTDLKAQKGEELQLDAETDYDIIVQFSRNALLWPTLLHLFR